MASLNQAVQLDTLRMQQQMQLGQPPQPKVDLDSAIEQVLLDGGWTDIDAITRNEAVSQGTPAPQGMEGGLGGNPYRPLRSVESSVLPVDVQESNWKFESGRIRECERIVKLLTLGE